MIMDTIQDYEKLIEDTAQFPPELGLLYPVLGLVGEAGEVAEKVKKSLRNGDIKLKWDEQKGCHFEITDPILQLELIKELGDIQWYVGAAARALNSNLQEIMRVNTAKLLDRKNRNKIIGEGDNR